MHLPVQRKCGGTQGNPKKHSYIVRSALFFLSVLCTSHLEHRFALPPFLRLSPKEQSDLFCCLSRLI